MGTLKKIALVGCYLKMVRKNIIQLSCIYFLSLVGNIKLLHLTCVFSPSPIPLPFQVSAIASWDSSVHDSVHLNRVTPQNERIYLIVKTTVQLSHPAAMELVLRKRIAANIYNKQVNQGLILQLHV